MRVQSHVGLRMCVPTSTTRRKWLLLRAWDQQGLRAQLHPICSPTWDDAIRLDWRVVDRALRDIARRRAKLDAEEARWLREAERLQIWRPLGMVSAVDYLERVLGHTPHVANERLRVARALGDLPVLTDAFTHGELQFSAIRELTRVATPATETRWRDAAVGKNVRQIEELVAGHRRGDDPEDPKDPEVCTHAVRFELGAEVFARLRQVRTALSDERGRHLDDDQLINNGRCQTPGCRSTVGLEIHHMVRRADGGSHDPTNLALQCSLCHLAIHRGTLTITRTESGRLEVQRRQEPRSEFRAGAKLDATIVHTQARDALVGLGWKPAIARAAVDEAWSHVGPAVAIEHLIREALRRCPKPLG